MSSTAPAKNNTSSNSYFKPFYNFVAPPLIASLAIIPCYGDLVKKSAEQLNEPYPKLSLEQRIKGGFKIAPTVGLIIGTQMVLQKQIEKNINQNTPKNDIQSLITSSFIVGLVSAPILAVFNGQTIGLDVFQSLKRFSFRQASFITLQETSFVFGISAADRVSSIMNRYLEPSQYIDYAAAFLSGALGSLVGHPPNTFLTKEQKGMKINSLSQTMHGALRKAKAIGMFSLFYKIGTDALGRFSDK